MDCSYKPHKTQKINEGYKPEKFGIYCLPIIFVRLNYPKFPHMKKLLALTFLIFLITPLYSQFNSEKAVYAAKVEKFKRMKTTGTLLTVAGGVLIIVGVTTISNAPSTTTYYNGQPQTTYGGNAPAGAVALLVGMGGMGAGIPLWIVGANAQRKYTQKLEMTGININLNQQSSGIGLRYHF